MASPTVNVIRYSALLFGLGYGIVHQGTLQKSYDEKKIIKAQHHRQHLIEQGRAAYLKKQMEDKAGAGAKGVTLVTDPEDPSFDLEKLVDSWAKAT